MGFVTIILWRDEWKHWLQLKRPIIWTNDGIDCWRIYASLGLNELNLIRWTLPVFDEQVSHGYFQAGIVPNLLMVLTVMTMFPLEFQAQLEVTKEVRFLSYFQHHEEIPVIIGPHEYRKISNIRRTKSQSLNISHLGLQSSLRNIFEPSVKWRMKM